MCLRGLCGFSHLLYNTRVIKVIALKHYHHLLQSLVKPFLSSFTSSHLHFLSLSVCICLIVNGRKSNFLLFIFYLYVIHPVIHSTILTSCRNTLLLLRLITPLTLIKQCLTQTFNPTFSFLKNIQKPFQFLINSHNFPINLQEKF